MIAPDFNRRRTDHVVIERTGRGRWVEHARFAEITDAANYITWRRERYGAALAAVGLEMIVVGDGVTEYTIPATTAEAKPDQLSLGAFAAPSVEPEEAGDSRVAGAVPPFDS